MGNVHFAGLGSVSCLPDVQDAEQVHREDEILLVNRSKLRILLVEMHEHDLRFGDQSVANMCRNINAAAFVTPGAGLLGAAAAFCET